MNTRYEACNRSFICRVNTPQGVPIIKNGSLLPTIVEIVLSSALRR